MAPKCRTVPLSLLLKETNSKRPASVKEFMDQNDVSFVACALDESDSRGAMPLGGFGEFGELPLCAQGVYSVRDLSADADGFNRFIAGSAPSSSLPSNYTVSEAARAVLLDHDNRPHQTVLFDVQLKDGVDVLKYSPSPKHPASVLMFMDVCHRGAGGGGGGGGGGGTASSGAMPKVRGRVFATPPIQFQHIIDAAVKEHASRGANAEHAIRMFLQIAQVADTPTHMFVEVIVNKQAKSIVLRRIVVRSNLELYYSQKMCA